MISIIIFVPFIKLVILPLYAFLCPSALLFVFCYQNITF
nr:MAG TPA: hypothetical protein [Caudoviricetes sp.]